VSSLVLLLEEFRILTALIESIECPLTRSNICGIFLQTFHESTKVTSTRTHIFLSFFCLFRTPKNSMRYWRSNKTSRSLNYNASENKVQRIWDNTFNIWKKMDI
jgi:hypothetical protein